MQSSDSCDFDEHSIAEAEKEILAVGTSAAVYALDEARVLKKHPSANEAFQREKRIYDRLGQHDNIARLFGTTSTGLVLERGECLRKVLLQRKESRKSDSEMILNLIWAIQAAEGLLHIHSRGVIHADVGPHNLILVDSKRQIKWVDFEGSGIDDEPATASYDIHYWRPTEGDDASVNTDIFAFGCLLFEIEQGFPPYSDVFGDLPLHERVMQIERLYSQGQYPDISGLFFGQVILGCWTLRFQDMAQVLVALRGLSSQSLWATIVGSVWERMVAMISTTISSFRISLR
ncbi:hypothetical protein B0A52_03756 [Exophiala mesophila]|uniref:Protein kinase domain-containing protein n=1 Tax=Exophiala mesophila TaxID=212818 RepID=A0A438N754_EXOME|nr:hypothetical protein B0A52_03756 [Exophiala mesophila]